MTDQIFLLQDDSRLVEMREAAYDSESLLQELLADYPDLLAGEQIDSQEPRRWLLIQREVGVPVEEEGAGRWSLDHLFVDQDAIPTLIEVKRSSDTRIRREVVGQMLDYAANAVLHWPMDRVRSLFETRCEIAGESPDEVLADCLGIQTERDEFWQKFKTNLEAGKIRLVFVADVIPTELRRIIEFLNAQTDPVEVLGVEIRQYLGKDMKTLVPRVLGKTIRSEQKRPSSGTSAQRSISREEFVQCIAQLHGDSAAKSVEAVYRWADDHDFRVRCNKAATQTCNITFCITGRKMVTPLRLSSPKGNAVLVMPVLRRFPPFTNEECRARLPQEFGALPGWDIRGGMTGHPHVLLAELRSDADRTRFLKALDWIVAQIKEHGEPE